MPRGCIPKVSAKLFCLKWSPKQTWTHIIKYILSMLAKSYQCATQGPEELFIPVQIPDVGISFQVSLIIITQNFEKLLLL